MTGRSWAIHPFLVAPFPALLLYSRNARTVDASEVFWPVGLSLAASLIALAILRAGRLDAPRAALLVSAALLLFFSFGPGVRLVERPGIVGDRVVRERVVLALEVAAMVAVVVLLARKPGIARGLTGACNAGAVALVGLSIAGIMTRGWGGPPPPDPRPSAAPTLRLPASGGRPPDVYLLILDAYGRSDVLKSMYGFDNSGFLGRLERKGFVVARSSRANYCQTALSLAATLNLRYLDDLAGSRSTSRLPLRRLIAENPTFRAFRDRGYRVVTFASGFDATDALPADLTLAPAGHLGAFTALVVDQTPLWRILGQQARHDPYRQHRGRILKVLDELPAALHPSDAPTFTFAHALAPHPPFIFGADGRDLSASEGTYSLNDAEGWRKMDGHDGPEDYARRYRAQVAFLTDRVEQSIDRILATSASPPIILIQGDHGPGSHFDSGDDRPNDIHERMGILNACYLPPAARGRIVDAITPINTLRAVLDECFGAGLGPLEDRSYYSSYTTPYAFVDVTADLDRPHE